MKYTILILTLLILRLSTIGQESTERDTKEISDNKIEVVNFEGLRPYLEKSNDTLYIINFWATWCAPCIKELPYFQNIHSTYDTTYKVKVLLVSLDFKRQLESRVIPFVEKNNITAQVILLSDPDSNKWINQVDTSWSGSIPATIFRKGNKKLFFEKEFNKQELEEIVKNFLDQ